MSNGSPRVLILLGLAALTLIVAPFIGPHGLVFPGAGDPALERIFWKIRFPRVILGFLAGAGLGIGGLVFQTLFRNPLATPYTLGVASGASFGAAAAIRLALFGSFLGFGWVQLFALLGAVGATFLVYRLSLLEGRVATATMLLAGVAVGYFFSSLILFLQYTSRFAESFQLTRWLMGDLETVGYNAIWSLLPFVIAGFVVIGRLLTELDQLGTGEELAMSRGVEVERVKLLLFAAVSLMIGAIVSVTGPIGFVGMMVPHVCRLLVGEAHTVLAPLTFVLSGAFLVSCDALARIVVSPAELPVGVVTALLGGPFFLWLLLRGQRTGAI